MDKAMEKEISKIFKEHTKDMGCIEHPRAYKQGFSLGIRGYTNRTLLNNPDAQISYDVGHEEGSKHPLRPKIEKKEGNPAKEQENEREAAKFAESLRKDRNKASQSHDPYYENSKKNK